MTSHTAPNDRVPTADAPDEHAADRPLLAEALAARTPAWKPILAFVAIAAAIGGAVVAGALPKFERAKELGRANASFEELRRRVQLGVIRQAPSTTTLALPASLEPWAQVTLFPQATGYVRERTVDIGDKVRKGDVLATIDVPLVADDLAAAEASLAAAQATREQSASRLAFAEASLTRATAASDGNAVSVQELDERRTTVRSLQAEVAAADATIRLREATIGRLRQELVFATVTAPFDGTITDRGIDVGDYVEPASGSNARAMFRIADLSSLRTYVDVPQRYAQAITPGLAASVTLPGRAGAPVSGTVTRTAGALDERARTLRVEIAVPNRDGALLGNAYGEATLTLVEPRERLLVPGSAVVIRADGAKVAIVDAENRIRYRPVTLGRDLGSEVEVLDGLASTERLVTNLADEIPEGAVVDPLAPATPPATTKK
jgi:RND family efflux transporter MFP subunit